MASELKELVFKMNRLDCYKRYAMHKMLRDSGVYSGQPPVLDYLSEHGECSQKELSDGINVSPASVAVSVKRMQKSGLITKISDENDLRCNRIALTENGKQRTEYIHSQFDKLDKRMFKGFTKEELSLLNSFLNRLIDNISEDAPSEKAIFEMMMKSHEKGGDDNV